MFYVQSLKTWQRSSSAHRKGPLFMCDGQERERETVQLPLAHSFHAALQVDGQCYVPTIELNMFYPVDVEYRSRTHEIQQQLQTSPSGCFNIWGYWRYATWFPSLFLRFQWDGRSFFSEKVYGLFSLWVHSHHVHYWWICMDMLSIYVVYNYPSYPHYWIQITLAFIFGSSKMWHLGFPWKPAPGPLKDPRSDPLATSTRKQLLPSSKSITVRGL